ncbi:HNH endonuclease [Cohnella lubricantis]|uniref:HNH endonuclease n=2 Tax=Cohnella lubricantis TaxID=2163172 RepID=A0A841TBU7_9BACL|nr:HNH endonuclease [Cohnella lubricantis]
MHMHREVLNAPDGFEVDHINGNTLDNRKSNLRIVTHQRNMHNVSSHGDSSSQYRGVFWNKQKLKWTAQICLDGKRRHIGHFVNELDAARAYNQEAIRLFGQYARLNQL